jgi:hypothetical protein
MGGLVEDSAVEGVHGRVHSQGSGRPGTIHERNSSDGGPMLGFLTRLLLVFLLGVTIAGCSAIAGIFKAGFWVGLIVAALVIIGIFAVIGRRG